jgi:NAD dependent epimerase/dehydratase family enzyme
MGLGGRHGTGNQKFSWIHIKDLIQIVEYFRLKEDTQEVYNFTAPKVTTNKGFLKVLRNQLGVKFGLRSPKWLLKIGTFLLRTETELVLKSRNVIPERLDKEGFVFQFPTIELALKDLCKE